MLGVGSGKRLHDHAVEMGAALRSQGQRSKIGAVKRSRENLTLGQAVKADFRGSRILTPVADGSMGSVGVTTPWQC